MTLPHDDVGEGPAVLLLHAGVADRRMWREHIEPVAAAGYRVVAVDLPGFGEAEIEGGEQAPWNDVLASLRDLGIERAALVGNSFGGAVALRTATIASGLAWALVLVAAPAPGFEPSEQLEAAWAAEEEAVERGDVDAAVEAVVRAWTLPAGRAEVRELVAVMQRRALELQTSAPAVAEAPDPLERPGLAVDEALARLGMPSLVVAGGRDLPDFIDSARQLSDALPAAELVTIATAGHLVPLDEPEEFRTVLLEFLDRQRP
jgi:pimeloyl-ACP methyl ester carboxylesterase